MMILRMKIESIELYYTHKFITQIDSEYLHFFFFFFTKELTSLTFISFLTLMLFNS